MNNLQSREVLENYRSFWITDRETSVFYILGVYYENKISSFKKILNLGQFDKNIQHESCELH